MVFLLIIRYRCTFWCEAQLSVVICYHYGIGSVGHLTDNTDRRQRIPIGKYFFQCAITYSLVMEVCNSTHHDSTHGVYKEMATIACRKSRLTAYFSFREFYIKLFSCMHH